MTQPRASPQSSLRQSVLQVYRARGRGKNNLWLVYSVKTDSDWILPSDRQLVHWLYFLEANPEVRDFDLAPEPIISEDDKETRATELDAIVHLRSGKEEWHEVKAGESKHDPEHASQKIAQATAAASAHATYKRFDDADLKPKVKVAMRWFKAIGFAAVIRGESHKSCHTALISTLREWKQGSVRQIINQLSEFDPAIVHGLLVRLAIGGVLHLDLEKSTYGLLTHWTYHGQTEKS